MQEGGGPPLFPEKWRKEHGHMGTKWGSIKCPRPLLEGEGCSGNNWGHPGPPSAPYHPHLL